MSAYSGVSNVVTNGLVLYLDSGNYLSYNGIGSHWNDLSGSNDPVTLQNSPTNNNGNLNFSGTLNQMGFATGLAQTMTKFTCEAWVNFNTVGSNPTAIIVQQRFSATNYVNFALGFCGLNGQFTSSPFLNGGFSDNTSWHLANGIIPSVGIWSCVAVVFDGTHLFWYTNGIQSSIVNTTANVPQSNLCNLFNVAMRWDGPNYLDAQVPIIRVYNRNLSSNEILQNFVVQRARFGV
jgi:hypothetical protein